MNFEQISKIAHTIQGWMTEKELWFLYNTAKNIEDSDHTWVEVGVYQGKSFFVTAMGLPPGSRLVAVDTWSNNYDVIGLPEYLPSDFLFAKFMTTVSTIFQLRPDISISVMRMHSCQAAKQIPWRPDTVFIDADHTKSGVEADCQIWKPKSLIMGHDADITMDNCEVIEGARAALGVISFIEDTTIWWKQL